MAPYLYTGRAKVLPVLVVQLTRLVVLLYRTLGIHYWLMYTGTGIVLWLRYMYEYEYMYMYHACTGTVACWWPTATCV